MEKSYLPEGITEEKFVEIVEKVCRNSAAKFQFGYHDLSDMQQYSMQLAITFLQRGKFKPRGTKPMEQQLSNFLRVWIYNRLSNYRRDNCCRYPNNGGANQTKFNLMYPLKIFSQNLASSEMFAREGKVPEKLSLEEVIGRIRGGLKEEHLSLYNKYINDSNSLTEKETAELFAAVREILPGESEEYI